MKFATSSFLAPRTKISTKLWKDIIGEVLYFLREKREYMFKDQAGMDILYKNRKLMGYS